MLFPLLLTLAATPDFAEMKLDRRNFDYDIVGALIEGLNAAPISKGSTRFNLQELSGEVRAELTTRALTQVKGHLESPEGRQQWVRSLQQTSDSVAHRSASYAMEFAYWTTLARERRKKNPLDAGKVEKATQNLAAFKRDRPRLEKEELTREKAMAQPDDNAFRIQLKERLTYFLGETKTLPFDAKLVEVNGKNQFADRTLEAKPKWWKFCFRVGPEATKAARDFATSWLAELNAPASPSRLSGEK